MANLPSLESSRMQVCVCAVSHIVNARLTIRSTSIDAITFYTFKLGLMYLGLTPFPISTRNSAIAIAHFVRTLGIRQMLVSGDPAMQRLARDTNALLSEEGKEFELVPMPDFEDLYGPGGDDELMPMGEVSPNKTCIILHSSGECPPPLARARRLSGEVVCRFHGSPEAYQVPGQELQEMGNILL